MKNWTTNITLIPRCAWPNASNTNSDGHTRFWQNVEFLPQFDRPDNFLVNAEVGAETPLTKRLSLQTVVQDNFANGPAPGRKDNDVKLVSALAYKF